MINFLFSLCGSSNIYMAKCCGHLTITHVHIPFRFSLTVWKWFPVDFEAWLWKYFLNFMHKIINEVKALMVGMKTWAQ